MHKAIAAALLAQTAASFPAWASPETPGAQCSVKSRNASVVIMVCPPRVEAAGWRAEATRACEGKTLCNVWIWDDVAKAPVRTPATDADMPKDRARQAVAVWANDVQSLVTLRRARTN